MLRRPSRRGGRKEREEKNPDQTPRLHHKAFNIVVKQDTVGSNEIEPV